MAFDADHPVRAVLDVWGRGRGAQPVRPFDHGVGGTSLIDLDGSLRVSKARRLSSVEDDDRLDGALELAALTRERGVPVPVLIERGRSGGYGYLVYEFVEGEWSDVLGPSAAADPLSVIAPPEMPAAPNAGWAAELDTMLSRGDASFDIDPAALAASTSADAVLTEARRRLAACDPSSCGPPGRVRGDLRRSVPQWSVGTDLEEEVLDLAQRMLRLSGAAPW